MIDLTASEVECPACGRMLHHGRMVGQYTHDTGGETICIDCHREIIEGDPDLDCPGCESCAISGGSPEADDPSEAFEEMQAYASTPEATCEGVAERLNRLDRDEWQSVIEDTSMFCPLPEDGRGELNLGDGGHEWSVMWWDATGRRVVARLDGSTDEWAARVDDADEPTDCGDL